MCAITVIAALWRSADALNAVALRGERSTLVASNGHSIDMTPKGREGIEDEKHVRRSQMNTTVAEAPPMFLSTSGRGFGTKLDFDGQVGLSTTKRGEVGNSQSGRLREWMGGLSSTPAHNSSTSLPTPLRLECPMLLEAPFRESVRAYASQEIPDISYYPKPSDRDQSKQRVAVIIRGRSFRIGGHGSQGTNPDKYVQLAATESQIAHLLVPLEKSGFIVDVFFGDLHYRLHK